jgi:hypothetical protein
MPWTDPWCRSLAPWVCLVYSLQRRSWVQSGTRLGHSPRPWFTRRLERCQRSGNKRKSGKPSVACAQNHRRPRHTCTPWVLRWCSRCQHAFHPPLQWWLYSLHNSTMSDLMLCIIKSQAPAYISAVVIEGIDKRHAPGSKAASRAGTQFYHASQGQDERAPAPQLHLLPGLDLAWSWGSNPHRESGTRSRAAADVGQADVPEGAAHVRQEGRFGDRLGDSVGQGPWPAPCYSSCFVFPMR